MNVVKLTILCVLAKNQLLETLQLKAVTIPSSEPCRPRPIRAKPRNVLVPAKSLSESINKVKKTNTKSKTKRTNSKNTNKNIRITYHEYNGMLMKIVRCNLCCRFLKKNSNVCIPCTTKGQEGVDGKDANIVKDGKTSKTVKDGKNATTIKDGKDAKVLKATKRITVKKSSPKKKYVITKVTEKGKLVNVKQCPSCAAFMKLSAKGLCNKCREKKNDTKKTNQNSNQSVKSTKCAPKKKNISPEKQITVLENIELQTSKELKQELLDDINSQNSVIAEDYYVSLDDIKKIINRRSSL